MRGLIWGKTFIKAFKRVVKKRAGLDKKIEQALILLTENPFALQLETHKLKGKLAGTWACSLGYDLRLIFVFIKSDEGKEDDILLIEIGTHDEVY